MKLWLPTPAPLLRVLWAAAMLFFATHSIFAEGSVDFINRPGYRLHLSGFYAQQFKVYAEAGEFINVGSSNLAHGGTIKVYKPNGALTATFDETSVNFGGIASIDSLEEEKKGPIGAAGGGYDPGIVQVGAGESGIWTVVFTCSSSNTNFPILLNNDNWVREIDQTVSLTIIAWDITVSKNAAADNNGLRLKGRVFTQELISFIREADRPTSPQYYVLTKEGYLYKLSQMELDPVQYRLSSNNVGLVKGGDQSPQYYSVRTNQYSTSGDLSTWHPDSLYLYRPQAQDTGIFVNNKIFFNPPAADMPTNARVTDVFTNNTYTTWLLRTPTTLSATLGGFSITGNNGTDTCFSGSIQAGVGGTFHFTSSQAGVAQVCLDINNNGSFSDPVDRKVYGYVNDGPNNIFWDGRDGLGNPLPAADDFVIPYKLSIRAGGMHVLYFDVETSGGFTLTLQNQNLGTTDFTSFNYDHSTVGGPVSGGGTPGNPLPTSVPNAYPTFFGEDLFLNYWKFYTLAGGLESQIIVDIKDDCTDTPPIVYPDNDGDGITDNVDIDDDNDGVPDAWEYCNPNGSFACLPNALDPSGDADADGVLNFQDANDPAYPNACTDGNADGTCDNLPANFDTDKDGVADHIDLDSDNDGLTDLFEAGHAMIDSNGDGVIDGPNAAFGLNGLFDLIDSDPTSISATANYMRFDFDNDGVPDHDDLDSDNDGINDVMEAGYGASDTNNDGRIDATANADGLVPQVDPAITGMPIPLPPDTDNGGVPDWHDLDSDDDGIWDVMEGGVPDPDYDGIVGTGTPVVNTDGQGTGATSTPTNTDGDAWPDFQELDSDNDFIPDPDECPAGTPCVDGDGDGAPDFQDIDRDDDGIDDNWECETSTPCVDTDTDGTSDVDDHDSDNDGQSDMAECPNGAPCPDGDMDGIPDFREFDCTVVAPGGIPNLVNFSGSGTYCTGTSVVLTGQNSIDTIGGPVFYAFSNANDSLVATGFLPSVTGFASFIINNLSNSSAGTYTLVLAGANGCASPPVDFVIEINGTPDAPNLSISDDTPCASDDVTLSVPAVSGVNITYDWYFNDGSGFNNIASTGTPNLDLGTVSSTETGQYYVIVDAGGCVSPVSNTVSLAVTSAPSNLDPANSTGGFPVCAGASASLSIPTVPGATYTWNGPNGYTSTEQNPVISPLTTDNTGLYWVVVNLNGCDFTSTSTNIVVRPQPDAPSLGISAASVCEGGSALLSVPAFPGPGVTYEWFFDNGSGFVSLGTTTTPSFSIDNADASDAGQYYAIIKAFNCVSGNSNIVNLDVTSIPANQLTAGNSTSGPVCAGGSITLTMPTVPGATYQWSGPGGFSSNEQNPVIAPSTTANSGAYSCVVTLNGCPFNSTTTNLAINTQPGDPTLSAADNTPCLGSAATLSVTAFPGTGVLYEWFFNGGGGPVSLGTTTAPTFPIPNFTAANNGQYYAIIVAGDCSSGNSNTVTLNVVQPNVPLTAGNSAAGPLCSGPGSVTLTMPTVAGATYLWSGPGGFSSNQQNPTISPLTTANSGTYACVVTIDGCPFNSTTTSIQVNATPATPNLTASTLAPCPASNPTLTTTAVAGATYQWYFNPGSGAALVGTTPVPTLTIANFQAALNGEYYVVVVLNGCTSSNSNTVTLDMVDAPADLTAGNSASGPLCEGQSVTLTMPTIAGATYLWSGPNGFSSTQQNPVISPVTPANSGSYSCTVTLSACTFPSTSTSIQVKATPAAVQIGNNGPLCETGTATLTVSNPPAGNITFRWFDGQGNLLGTTSAPTFNLNNPVSGNYTVQIEADGCTSAMSAATALQVDQIPSDVATVSANDLVACDEASINIAAVSPATATGRWVALTPGLTFGDANAATTTVSGLQTGQNQVQWVLSNGTCTDFSSATLRIENEGAIDASDDAYTVAQGASLTGADIVANDDVANTGQWTISIQTNPKYGTASIVGGKLNYTPRADYSGPDELVYEICSERCPDICSTAKVTIQVGDDLFIPNVITPNDDGLNDGLVIPGLQTRFPNNRLCIFNRWGDIVLDVESYKNDWKGTWNDNDLPAGTYFIMLFPDKSNKDNVKSQYMTIVRH